MSRWSRWVGLLDRREPAVALAMYRIAIGSCLLYAVGTVWAGGLVEAIWMDIPYGGYRNVGNEAWLVELAGGASPEVVWPLVIGSVVAGLAIVLGVGGRLPALVGLLAFQNLGRINGHCGGSYDPLMTNALWLLFLSDSTATFSVDAWRRGALWSGAQVPAWPRWLMMVQLVLLYASSGVHKVSADWVPGGDFSALYYILQQPSWQRIPMDWLAPYFPITQVMTASVWLFEVGSPLLWLAFWYRHTRSRPGWLRATFNRVDWRLLFAIFGLSMHVGIFALMEVGPFSWISMSLYISLFSGDEWARALGGRGSEAAPAGQPQGQPAAQ